MLPILHERHPKSSVFVCQMPGRGADHRLTPRYEEVERQYASLPRYCIFSFLCLNVSKKVHFWMNITQLCSFLFSSVLLPFFSLHVIKPPCSIFLPKCLWGGLCLSQELTLPLLWGKQALYRVESWSAPPSKLLYHVLRVFFVSLQVGELMSLKCRWSAGLVSCLLDHFCSFLWNVTWIFAKWNCQNMHVMLRKY